jgi:outer membrane protein assembly factor BamB
MITRWSNVIHNAPVIGSKINQDSPRYEQLSDRWWNFVRSRAKRVFWDRFPEEFKQEIMGIADGVKERDIKFHGRDVDYLDVLASNEMYEFMTRFVNPMKGFHPLRSLYGVLKDFVPMSLGDENNFINSFLSAPPAHHCNGFIATGAATTGGQMVVSQTVLCGGWWYPYYIPQRWNVIIDIVPSDGYRFMMPSAPGYIWSDQNYYQNEKGITFVDTTCIQGLWREGGYPMAIRTRMAAQYGDNMDDVIDYLLYKNDGIWTAVYLIGDIKTGEIARLDLGMNKYEIWRTFDGYYWTANNAMSSAVRAESYGLALKGGFLRFLTTILKIPSSYMFMTRKYFPSNRDLAFEELGKKLHGEIDIEVLKNNIMAHPRIGIPAATDVKAADTQMVENMSMWAFFGNVRGKVWDTSNLKNNLAGIIDVPPIGWTKVYGLPEEFDYKMSLPKTSSSSDNSDLVWTFDFAEDFKGRNMWQANLVLDNQTLYGGGDNGIVYALDPRDGDELWNTEINDGNTTMWINGCDDLIFVGWDNETCALDQKTGNIVWRNVDVGFVSSKPVFIDDLVLIGTRHGKIYALDKLTGNIVWQKRLNKNSVHVNTYKNKIFSTVGNRCYALDPNDGELIWDYKIDGDIVAAPCIVKNTIYFGSSDTKLYALDLETGDFKWEKGTGWGVVAKPVVSNNMVFVGSMDNSLYALDQDTGDKIWSYTCNAAVRSTPLVYGDYVFFGSDDGWFYALDKTSGDLKWRYAPEYTIHDYVSNYVTTSITSDSVADNGLVIMSANGMIYGLEAQTYEKPTVEEKNKEVSFSSLTEIFIILSIVFIVVVTALYLVISKKR